MAASGGGIWAAGTLTLVRTTVASNDAVGDGEGQLGRGGGVGLPTGQPATMVNTTLSGNTTNGQGGGLYTQRSSFLQNVSIVDNQAPPRVLGVGQGGGLFQSFTVGGGQTTRATNVLVARNVNGGCGGTQNFPIDSDNGLVDEPLPNTTCNAVGDANQIVPNAFLGALEFNEGLTRTHALLGNSPAIDGGAGCESSDQRGVPRPFGPACDIGAYERDSLPDVNTFADGIPDGCTVAHCTLRERIDGAVQGDVITLQAGTYDLTRGAQLDLDEDIAINGAGPRATTIDANRTSRIGYVEEGANVTVTGVTVTGGDADTTDDPDVGQGGAFRVDSGGELDLVQTALVGNFASATGGAISNIGRLLFVESLASGNQVQGNNPALGGAIWSIGGVSALFNSTISGNAAIPIGGSETRGGGIYFAGLAELEHVTITGNSAEEGAGLYHASGDSATFGTMIAGNPGPECGLPSLATGGENHNISDDATCQFDDEGDMQGVDPRLAPLANNGGPTNTHALYTGSPAIDGQAEQSARRGPAPLQPAGRGVRHRRLRRQHRPALAAVGRRRQPATAAQRRGAGTASAGRGQDRQRRAGGRHGQGQAARLEPLRRARRGTADPSRLVVDTPKGRVTILAAGNQQADFYDGIFKLGQGKGAEPLTTLTLVEKLSCPKAGNATIAAKKKKRRLWGDGSGKFRTEGKHSAATVVGTKWLVEDKCTSTLTRVTRGRVSVRDFVKKKTVIVRAGKKYVARAKKP